MKQAIKLFIIMTVIGAAGGCSTPKKEQNKQVGNPLLTSFNTPHATVPFSQIEPAHFMPAYEQAFAEGRKEIKAIIDNPASPDFKNTIEALEEAGGAISRISSILFNLDAAETSEAIQKVTLEVSPLLTKHSNDIMLNEALFARVKAAYEATDKAKLSPEQQTLLEKTYRSFTRNGALLSEEEKAEYRKITTELSSLSLAFGQNVLHATNAYELLITEQADLKGLPQGTIDAAAELAKERNKEGWVFTLQNPSLGPFLKYADNRELRKQLYMENAKRCCHGGEYDNKEIVSKIVNLRLRKAQVLGYTCYADYVLEERMAKSSDKVFGLLDELLDAFKPGALAEYEQVSAFAAKQGHQGKVEPWDWSYYSEKLRELKYAISEEETKVYFDLEKVKQGVFGLATRLWGIRFEKNKEIDTYHSEVEVFEVFDKDGSLLAILYTDFHPRAGKQPGAWMTSYREAKEGVRPHVSIVMNFTRPTSTKPALLTFYEVETFLHEFGHALHGIFANTKYESLSGTDVNRDFVELPSQIMENWALEPAFLNDFAKHYETGEVIPAEMIEKIKASANYLVAYQCCRQLSFGFLDMAWHSIEKEFSGDVMAFEEKAMEKTQVLPRVAGFGMSPIFGHLFAGGYAAGYYSYKWAEVLDADAYALFQERGVFDQATADAFRKHILEKGGTEDQMELYRRFRGQDPTVKALLKRSGL